MKMHFWHFTALSMMFATVTPVFAAGEQAICSDKTAMNRHELWSYAEVTKFKAERAWTANSKIQLRSPTNIKVVLDHNGKVSNATLLSSTGNSQQDKQIEGLFRSLKFTKLPCHRPDLDLFWTLRSDSGKNFMDYAQIPEADKYRQVVFGGSMSRFGSRMESKNPG